MRLSKIKLAGFKSFVDPTTIHLPSNLVGIVGPNGCGKSNVIDAVRWVMGESSAKSLRGESMADVIFNGSSSRKPVSQASIELVFDNSDGSLAGQYAHYSEISIKRHVSRDGQSSYFLNGTRCRRRDITDIFLGTGLGPHSYAIIEQNMISRLIDAKPDELRIFLEEAAGISKYKERRRETENRMRHTRENLDRVNDVREELAKQLERLQRQANVAEKYKLLKQQERQVKAELLALRWRALVTEASVQDKLINEQQTALEGKLAEQRAIEAALEKRRAEQTDVNEAFNAVQGKFYGVGAEVARVEQAILHAKERRRQQQQDLQQVEQSWLELQAHLDADHKQISELTSELEKAEPEWQQAQQLEQASGAALTLAEQAMHAWQAEWEDFNQRATQPAQTAQIERTRMQHLEQQLQQFELRRKRLSEEQHTLVPAGLEQDIAQLSEQQGNYQQQGEVLQAELQGLSARISELRQHHQSLSAQLDTQRSHMEGLRGRLGSLEALQEAALGKRQGAVNAWLQEHGLQQAPRLAQNIEVDKGWERAVECVLNFHLEAVCVSDLGSLVERVSSLQQESLSLFDTSSPAAAGAHSSSNARLIDKVRSPWQMDVLLANVYTADTLPEALALAKQLGVRESVITRDGVWLGQGWLHVKHDADEKAGVLARAQEIKEIEAALRQLGSQVGALQQQLDDSRAALQDLEERREQSQASLTQVHRHYGELQAQLSSKQTRVEQMRARARGISAELEELDTHITQAQQEQTQARSRLHQALAESEALDQHRETLVRVRDEHRAGLEVARNQARADRDTAHQMALRIQAARAALVSAQQRLERMQGQYTQMQERREQLQAAIAHSEAPLEALQGELEQLLARRLQVETELSQARRTVEEFEHALRQLEHERQFAESKVQQARSELEQIRLRGQELKVRSQTVEDQIKEAGFEAQDLLSTMASEASEPVWQEEADNITQKIQRLGSINLAAIDEFAEQSERKNYLDAQFADLTEALTTLEEAIRKIDRETRARFKDTFDKVNTGLQSMFPRLFGGGNAYLELSGDDLLNTGVTVMARPPGKRNSTIHLLSGGEKALTAVALVFAIFELTPAPFCMLDEVDAPLDEANVGRFCALLKEMSAHIQFIYITHNKASMEIAHQLTGVTMHEPGVSRLVAVDIDEAAAMVAV